MSAIYLLLKDKKILRLEPNEQDASYFKLIAPFYLDGDKVSLTQDEANWRVAIFRDEIIEWEEFLEMSVKAHAFF